MLAKGKAPKGQTAVRKDRSLLFTFPRGDGSKDPRYRPVRALIFSPRKEVAMSVFVLDKRKKPLMLCSEKRARLLLERGRARIHKMRPFTIRLVDRLQEQSQIQPIALTLDPGSKTTGIALSRTEGASRKVRYRIELNHLGQAVRLIDCFEERLQLQLIPLKIATLIALSRTELENRKVLFLIELKHRDQAISDNLKQRSGHRGRRRSKLRFRPKRFDNRTRPEGWLPPSVQHRIDSTMAIVHRLRKFVPVSSISMELVRFDMQLIQNPEIKGIEYQQGELAGYEVREYLLEKFHRTCIYCDVKNVPLQIEHLISKAKGGSNRISNLGIACGPCNQKKESSDIREFVKDGKRLKEILATAKAPLKDAAAVNSTRWALKVALKSTGLMVETATGGRTKWNRTRFGIPKIYALDAACVGVVDSVSGWEKPTLTIKAMGRGSYQRTPLNTFGFPAGKPTRSRKVFGFQTGDLVKADVPKGKKVGIHVGRVAIRATGSFNIQTAKGTVQGIGHRHCSIIQQNDGYAYNFKHERVA
jgi:5-methylcytosine-specific restriction endonuclease McrA